VPKGMRSCRFASPHSDTGYAEHAMNGCKKLQLQGQMPVAKTANVDARVWPMCPKNLAIPGWNGRCT
jgi:hypothetical protein